MKYTNLGRIALNLGILSLVISSIIPTKLHAQTDVFQKYFFEGTILGTSLRHHLMREIEHTSDGGFIMGGSYISGLGNFYLIKTDGAGVWQWTAPLVGENSFGKSVNQTLDDGYIMCGHSGGTLESGGEIQVVKYTSSGSISWSRIFQIVDNFNNTNLYSSANCIRQTSDGGYILTGFTKATGTSDKDLFLIKLTSLGVVSWCKIQPLANVGGVGSNDEGMSVEEISTGGFIVSGYTDQFTPGTKRGTILKFNSTGVMMWEKVVRANTSILHSVQETTDGSFVATGKYTNGTHTKVLVSKVNTNGTNLWIRTYDFAPDSLASYAEGFSVKQVSDSGYVVSGGMYTYAGLKEQAFLLRIDTLGNEYWARHYGLPMIQNFMEGGRSVVKTTDGFAFVGWHRNLAAGDTSDLVFLVRTNVLGNSYCYNTVFSFTADNVADSVLLTGIASASTNLPDSVFIDYDPNTDDSVLCSSEVEPQIGTGITTDHTLLVKSSIINPELQPNPARAIAKATFKLEKTSDVVIDIIDINGKVISTVLQGILKAGDQAIELNTSALTSGRYLVRINVNGQVVALKLSIAK